MSGKAVGRAAVDLPWLCPNTDSLVGLAEQPADLGRLAAADPALFVFLVRFAAGDSGSPFLPQSDRLLSASLPETAHAYLTTFPAGSWLDQSDRVVASIRRVADRAAGIARRIADRTRRVAPEAADTAARLAPLGWYAVAAVDTGEASGCLHDPAFRAEPAGTQQSWWGLDHDAISRRLAGRWHFPKWLAALAGSLNLPVSAAAESGADPDLFAVVGLAVIAAQEQTTDLGLTQFAARDLLLTRLGLSADDLAGLTTGSAEGTSSGRSSGFDPNPHRVPLVRNLLRMAGQARRRSGAALVVRLEERIDSLHRAAADLARLAGDRLRDAKLAALAELAAGAGHEINNPLAVISGHAQRLLRTEGDDERAESFRSIVRQTQRISGILRDLMHFARPPAPKQQPVAPAEVIDEVRTDLALFAEEREVRVETAAASPDEWVSADRTQLRHALTAVVRNAVEAAGRGGWVRLGCEVARQSVRLVVEDSGPGLSAEGVEHAFDPFYCGRAAGRGRGLGLPTAWRLATQNGGDVAFEPTPGGTTRVVLTFPAQPDEATGPGRACA